MMQEKEGTSSEQGSTFKTLRLTSPERQQTYRVTHLGDNLSQRCCYFYTRRFAYQLPERLPDGEYHVRVSARDPFGNVGPVTGTIKTLR